MQSAAIHFQNEGGVLQAARSGASTRAGALDYGAGDASSAGASCAVIIVDTLRSATALAAAMAAATVTASVTRSATVASAAMADASAAADGTAHEKIRICSPS